MGLYCMLIRVSNLLQIPANYCASESVGLPFLILFDSIVLWNPLHLPAHQRRRLRSRPIHVRQSTILRQMVWTSQARNTI